MRAGLGAIPSASTFAANGEEIYMTNHGLLRPGGPPRTAVRANLESNPGSLRLRKGGAVGRGVTGASRGTSHSYTTGQRGPARVRQLACATSVRFERGPSQALTHAHHRDPDLTSSERREDALEWCKGRNWSWRAILLAYLAYVSVRSLSDDEYGTIFGGITLVVHEAGHVVFGAFGELLAVMGGSIMQLAIPLIVAMLFLRQREYFGIAVALAWLSTSSCNLAAYIGDARSQDLPLVSMGSGDPIHDWHYILGHFGMLGQDHALARLARFASFVSLLLAIVLGAWLCNAMRLSAGTTPPADEELLRG